MPVPNLLRDPRLPLTCKVFVAALIVIMSMLIVRTIEDLYLARPRIEQKVTKTPVTKQNVDVEKEEEEPVDMHLNYKHCDQARPFRKAVVINPFKKIMKDRSQKETHQKEPSVCLKCLMCLAVTEQINATLTRLCLDRLKCVRRNASSSIKPWDFSDIPVTQLITNICHQFKNFGLRDYNGILLISQADDYSLPFASIFDGTFDERLQKLCHTFVDIFGPWDILIHYMEYRESRRETLSQLLCRGHGVFGACKNLPIFNFLGPRSKFDIIEDPTLEGSLIKMCFNNLQTEF